MGWKERTDSRKSFSDLHMYAGACATTHIHKLRHSNTIIRRGKKKDDSPRSPRSNLASGIRSLLALPCDGQKRCPASLKWAFFPPKLSTLNLIKLLTYFLVYRIVRKQTELNSTRGQSDKTECGTVLQAGQPGLQRIRLPRRKQWSCPRSQETRDTKLPV